MISWSDRILVLAIHERQLAEHGGASRVRDEGLLDSALARPQQMLAYAEPEPEPDVADLAAALAQGLARNHPFVDGNKRTAYVATRVFFLLNGTDLVAAPEQKYQAFLALADGSLSAPQFADWLRARLRATRVQEAPARYVVRKRAAKTRTASRAPRR